jgi:UPF0271 protein
MTARIDLNCDIGEATDHAGIEREGSLLELVSSVSIACGGHAGDDETMRRTVRLALDAGCTIGAHPSYPDRAGFGRASVSMHPESIEREVRTQIERLADIAAQMNTSLAHAKPHGALYHDCARDADIAAAVANAAGGLLLFGGAGTASLDHWRALGHDPVAEAFADRAYEPDGTLRSRTLDGAVHLDPQRAASQSLTIARDRRALAHNGIEVRIDARTICVHSDTPGALPIARAVRSALDGAGIRVGRA